MNKKQSQSGFAHLAIILVLVVALLGALGFVFWQNFMQPKTVTDLSNVALSEVASDQVFGTNLSVKYPEGWTSTVTNSTSKDAEDFVQGSYKNLITSPDGNVEINFEIAAPQVVANCGYVNSVISSIDKDTIPGYSDIPLSFVSSVRQTTIDSGIYDYYVGVAFDSDYLIGDKACPLFSTMHQIPTAGLEAGMLDLHAEFKNIENDSISTLDSFNNIKSTDNYKIAKRIIQSLYIKD